MRRAAKRQAPTLNAKLARIGVLAEDSRTFLNGHRPNPHFRKEVNIILTSALSLMEFVHSAVTGDR